MAKAAIGKGCKATCLAFTNILRVDSKAGRALPQLIIIDGRLIGQSTLRQRALHNGAILVACALEGHRPAAADPHFLLPCLGRRLLQDHRAGPRNRSFLREGESRSQITGLSQGGSRARAATLDSRSDPGIFAVLTRGLMIHCPTNS